jgi:ATP-dependent DNA helicase RecG
MDEGEIVVLIADLETDRVERKASLSDADRVSEAISAFANDLPGHRAPGVVAIGVDDGGKPTGLAVDDALLRRFADLRDNGKISPFPSLAVSCVSLDGVAVATPV